MIGFKKFLTTFPSWSFSIIWILVMIWINLNPEPLIGSGIAVEHNMDKIGHCVVAGLMAVFIMLDYQRRNNGWCRLSGMNILACAGVAFIISATMELAQLSSFIFKRVFDFADLAAQLGGIVIFSLLYAWCQRIWTKD